jgi:hypothetical protein
LVVAPLLIVVGEAIVGDVHGLEVVLGAMLGTCFFLVTALVAGAFQNSPALRTAVMWSYLVKTALVVAMFLLVDLDQIDRNVFAFSTVVSAITYLLVQTVLIAQRNRFFRP